MNSVINTDRLPFRKSKVINLSTKPNLKTQKSSILHKPTKGLASDVKDRQKNIQSKSIINRPSVEFLQIKAESMV